MRRASCHRRLLSVLRSEAAATCACNQYMLHVRCLSGQASPAGMDDASLLSFASIARHNTVLTAGCLPSTSAPDLQTPSAIGLSSKNFSSVPVALQTEASGEGYLRDCNLQLGLSLTGQHTFWMLQANKVQAALCIMGSNTPLRQAT